MQVWNYEEGHCYYYGFGHSGAISRVQLSPDKMHIVTVGSEGAIFIWKMPAKVSA
jgi:hypothetical protein